MMIASVDAPVGDLERTVADLREALRESAAQRDAALAKRNSEYDERIEHQSATSDVLKAMSASPGDPQPVAVRNCRAEPGGYGRR